MVWFFRSVLFVCISVGAMASDHDMTAERVDYIQRALSIQRATLDEACGKEVVVLMGNTGSGKSTLANLLSDVPLEIDSSGRIVTITDDGFAVASGVHAITKYPTFLGSRAGMIWDCPGFNDTEGAVDDVLTAALIRELLTKASAVKAVFVTSVAEIEAARGPLFKSFLRTIGMFEEGFLESCLIVINKVESDIIDSADWLQFILEDKGERARLRSLCKKLIPVRKTRVTSRIDALFGDRDNLIRAIGSLEARPVTSVNLSVAFGAETADVLVDFFTVLAKKTLEEYQERIYREALGSLPMTSTNVYPLQYSCWGMLWDFVGLNPDCQLLRPLAEKQMESASYKFKEAFFREHARYVQILQVREYEETIRKREEEIKRLDEVRQESERRVREEDIKAEELRRKMAYAQKREREASEAAEAALRDATKSRQGREDALKRASEATIEKDRLAQEIMDQRVLAEEEERERQRTILEITESQKRLEQQARQLQSERDAIDRKSQEDLKRLQDQISALTGQLGEFARLEAQMAEMRAQMLSVGSKTNSLERQINDVRTKFQGHTHSSWDREGWRR